MNRFTSGLLGDYINPIIKNLIEREDERNDLLFHNAPLALYFYNTHYSDPADPYIPATYAMLAAESLGLGSCMVGTIHPFLQEGTSELKKVYHLPTKIPNGIFLVIGYPKYTFRLGIKRSFKSINIIEKGRK